MPARSHGRSRTPEYRAWINMISRCENERTPHYEGWGGRGISVCSEWRHSFECFLSDMGPRPTPKHSVDRRDVNLGYTPENCRWATQTEQMRNVRNNRLVTFRGSKVPLSEAVEELGLKYNTVLYRLRRGKTEEEALR